MNLLIELFFFIFTIQDSLSTPKLKLSLNGTKNQLIDTPKIKDSRLKDIDVFSDLSSIWYNMYPQDKASKPEKYMIKCDDGEYLNLCGECVGGKTEKDDSFGLDDCGICHGLQRCAPNGCKEASIESLDEEEGNCTQILGMKPSVVDLTDSSTKSAVNLIASDLNPKDIACSALIENKKLDVQIRESENGLILNFEKAKDEGKILLFCNTSEGVEFKHELLAVSSAKLKPISSDRSFLIYGQESRMIITVSNIFALADLICFAKQNGNIVYKYWTNDIQGNSLSSEVFCERIWPNDPSEMEFGVAYSEEAMEKAQTIKVAVNVPSPKLIQTKIKNGQVIVFFDINIPPSANCSSLKGLNLGNGAKCEVVANEFRIQFGQGSSVKKGQKFSINLLESKTYHVLLQESKGSLSAKIDGPEIVCSGESVEYKISGDENLGGNWTIGYSGKGNKGTSGNRQRMNLLLWRNVRENIKKWSDSREITLNTSLLMEGVDYEVKAIGKKGDGTIFEMKKNLKVTKTSSPLVYVKGSKKIDFKTDVMFEAQVLCKPSQDMDVHWKIGNIEQNGPKLYLKASNLNTKMTSVTVELIKENKPISQGKLDLVIEKTEMEPLTYFDQLVVGTGHDIHISINKENNDYNYAWSCTIEMSKCKTAGKPSKNIEEVGTLDGTELSIPRKTLPVGKYEIEIASSNGISTKKKVHVRVVAGEPPFISIVSVKTGSDIKIELRVSDVISSCEFSVDSLMENNYTFVDLKDVFAPKKLEGTPLSPTSFDFMIEIPEKVLKFGTKYKLRLNANCGALTQSYVVLDIPVREVVKTGDLEVNPLKGDALTTPFNLNLKNSALSETIYDFGFIFNETSYTIDKKLEPFTTIYSLPGKIKPFAKICQVGKICKTILGPEIDVEAKMNTEAAKNVLESFKTAVKSGMYDVAVGNAKIISEGAKTSDDYGSLSSEVDGVLTNKMEKLVSMLEKDDSVITDALDLLQSSLKIVDMVKTPDTSREKILQFRDSIQTAFRKKSGKMVENALLKRESRAKRQTNRMPKRTKEDVTVETVERFLESSVWLIHNSANKTQILMEKDSLIKKRIPDYLTDMCNSINTAPRHANSSIVELSATKVKNNGNRQEMRFPECSGVCGNGTGQIILSKSFFDKYNSTDGVCIGAAYLPNDFLSEITNATSEDNIIRQSGIYMSKIFKYEQNVAIKEVENATSKPIGVFRLLLWSGVEQSPDLKCHTWMNTTGWTHLACKTIKQLTINGRNALECKCPLQGIHAIFKNVTETTVPTTVSSLITNVPTNVTQLPAKTTESTTKTTPVLATIAGFTKKKENYRYTAGFVINENFNKTVGTRKSAFEENIKNQLIEKLKIPNETFIEANNQEENVKVTLKLECEDSRVPSVVIEMAKVLSRGDLKLKGLDKNDLSVPGQNLELYLSDKKSSSSSSYIILISCGIFVLITSVIAILLSGVFLKWRRELRAMNFIESMENHSRPKYLRLHESSSMEAIEQTYSSSQQRPGELDSGIVLTVDPNKMSSKYQPFDQITSHA